MKTYKHTILLVLLLACSLIISSFTLQNTSQISYSELKESLKSKKIDFETTFEVLLEDAQTSNTFVRGKFYIYTGLQNESSISYIYIGRMNSCKITGCDIETKNDSIDIYEYFDYFILFDKDCKIIETEVFNYQSTSGEEMTAKQWLSQFIGYDGNKPLNVGQEIDAIAGATVSVEAITTDIQVRSKMLKHYVLGIKH